MTTEIINQVLTALDRKLDVENWKVLLFLDNAPSHPETLQGNLKNIKLVYVCSYHDTYAFQSESTLYISWMSSNSLLETGAESEE